MFQPPGGPGAQQPQAQPDLPAPDPKLALDAPRGALFFLHSTADKASVVIGEAVVLTVYSGVEYFVRFGRLLFTDENRRLALLASPRPRP